jgi:eukaryotic-like serine/threonine-protein kinase
MSSNDTLLNGRYQLISTLGSGGMAVIYKAVDQLLGRTVAIKIMRPQLTKDPAFVQRFQNEARSVANLSHPNIVTVHDVGTAPTSDGLVHYMVMEYVTGQIQDLKKFIREKTVLPSDLAVNFAIQVCAGIGFAHRAGLVHADVKPQNVLLTPDLIVKVTDFGIAQAWSDTQPQSQERESIVWGSPHYFAPEQARGEKPTAASDVYSIGIVMFEMLTGRLPYVGASQHDLALAHIREKVPLISEVNPNLDSDLAKIIAKVMSKEPSARYRTADQLGHVLINFRERLRDAAVRNAPAPHHSSSPQTPPPTLPSQQVVPSSQNPPQSPVRPETPLPGPPPPYVSRPSPPPPVPVSNTMTQRINPAPEAPVAPSYARPAVQQPGQPMQQRYQTPMPGQPMPQQPPPQYSNYDSRGMMPPAYGATSARVMDGVTIALAVLAFIAVAGLIPLFLAVLQSYN